MELTPEQIEAFVARIEEAARTFDNAVTRLGRVTADYMRTTQTFTQAVNRMPHSVRMRP